MIHTGVRRRTGPAAHGQGRQFLRSVQRIWAAHGLKLHRVKTFKLSRDPKFAE